MPLPLTELLIGFRHTALKGKTHEPKQPKLFCKDGCYYAINLNE